MRGDAPAFRPGPGSALDGEPDRHLLDRRASLQERQRPCQRGEVERPVRKRQHQTLRQIYKAPGRRAEQYARDHGFLFLVYDFRVFHRRLDRLERLDDGEIPVFHLPDFPVVAGLLRRGAAEHVQRGSGFFAFGLHLSILPGETGRKIRKKKPGRNIPANAQNNVLYQFHFMVSLLRFR